MELVMAGNRLLRGQNLAGRGWLLCSSNLLLFEPPTAESMQCFLKHTETQDTLFLLPPPTPHLLLLQVGKGWLEGTLLQWGIFRKMLMGVSSVERSRV